MSTTAIEVSPDLASKLEQACDRIERLERRLTPLLELKEDLQPILNEAFRNLIVELDELDGHFRADDALHLGKRLLRDTRRLTGMLERLEQLDELVMDLTPVVNEAAKAAIVELGEMERQGLFELALAIRGVAARFASGYRPDEVMELGDRLMGLLELAGALGSPSSLKLLEAAVEGLDHAPPQAPGLLGLARLARDPDTRRGLATLLEVCRRLGGAAAGRDPAALTASG